MRLIPLLIILISCGSPENNSKRCFTREEAILSCQAEEISKSGVDASTAKMLCEPYYPYESCYEL